MESLKKVKGVLHFVDENGCCHPLCCPFKNIYKYNGSLDFTDATGCVIHVTTDEVEAMCELIDECNAACNDVSITAGDITIDNTAVVTELEGIAECLDIIKNQETAKERFIEPKPCKMVSVDDTKEENPIDLIEAFDCEANTFVQFLPGVEWVEENIFDNTNYIKMGYIQGTPLPEKLASLTTSNCVLTCIDPGATLTEAEILALHVAAGVLLPDGTPPTGIFNTSVTPLYPGQQAKDAAGEKKKLKAGGCAEVDGQVVNSGTTYCEPKKGLIDDDCDNFLIGEAVSVANTGTEVIAVRICNDLIPLDIDDTDPSVQREGGEEKEG